MNWGAGTPCAGVDIDNSSLFMYALQCADIKYTLRQTYSLTLWCNLRAKIAMERGCSLDSFMLKLATNYSSSI